MEINFIFQIAVIIISIVFHEISHGYAAYFLGDPTAKYEGRLTVNPIKHVDIMGSIVVPLLTYWLGGLMFGWAKPVPYNPYNLNPQKWGLPARMGEVIVALAGPVSNLFIAIVFAFYIRYLGPSVYTSVGGQLAVLIVLVNLNLALFNLIPFPPLDGSKILWGLVPYRFHYIKEFVDRNMFVFLIIVVIAVSYVLDPILLQLFKALTGVVV